MLISIWAVLAIRYQKSPVEKWKPRDAAEGAFKNDLKKKRKTAENISHHQKRCAECQRCFLVGKKGQLEREEEEAHNYSML